MASLERHLVLGEEPAQDLHTLLEPLHALGDRRERDPELAVLLRVPGGAHRALDAPARDMVHRYHLGGQHRGMSVSHASHEGSESHSRCLARECGEKGPRFERRSLRVSVERLEVVEHPHAVETRILSEPNTRDELVPGELVLGDV